MSFSICNLVPSHQVATLDASKGDIGRGNIIAIEPTSGDIYLKRGSAWVKIVNGGATPSEAAMPLTGAIAVKNSAGTVTRNLTATAGVVNLAATDAIVANGDSITLLKSTGAAATGTATLNSPAVAAVAAGAVTNVKAAA